MWTKLTYDHSEGGNILLPEGAPFDGEPVLIKTNTGIVEAWWMAPERFDPRNPDDFDGWCWVCYDDQFQCDLDDVLEWMTIPVTIKEAENHE